jgi:hypothetical protein
MGAWGIGIFQDDTALDFVGDLRDEDRPFDRMRAAFEDAASTEYLEYAAAQAALVSAAVVDAILSGSTILDVDDDLRSWVGGLDPDEARALRTIAAKACTRVLAAGSELNELWSENEDDYPRWQAQVAQLASRLSS